MKKYFNENYWDCECEHDYIHPKTEYVCSKCKAIQEEAPDSLNSEVINHQKEKPMKIQYFKKNNSTARKGVMVAIPVEEEGVVKFGYSLCHTKLDKFDKEFGKNIAVGRALCDKPLSLPDSMKKDFERFRDRCRKYYKQLEVTR